MKRAWTTFAIPGVLALFLAVLYLTTMPPGLTWAFDGADGGDLVTAAATGGVPHPTGYPTYVLAASAFLKLPVGSLAYRTNLLSAVCTVLAALVIYLLVQSVEKNRLAASVASLAFGTFPLVWSQAIITEVYALNALFAAVLLYISTREDFGPRIAIAGGVVAGLAMGNHLSIVLMLPLILAPRRGASMTCRRAETHPQRASTLASFVGSRMLGLAAGLSVYLVVPIRARSQAPVNWGNAVNGTGLNWLITGRTYWNRLGDFSPAFLWAGVQAWSHLLLEQLGLVGLLLVALVLALLIKRDWIYLATAWLILAYSGLSILFFSPDSYVYLIPALIGLAIWMGVAAQWIVQQVSSRVPRLAPMTVGALLAYLALHSMLAIPSMSRASDTRAQQYAQSVLTTAPARAMIFASGDEATFSLWYFHFAYHERPDVAVISSSLLLEPWYRAVVAYTYRDLAVAPNALEADIIRDNPARPRCDVRSDLQAASCSP